MGSNSTLLAIGAAVVGLFLLKGSTDTTSGGNDGSVPNTDQYGGQSVSVNNILIPFSFLQQNGYEFIDNEWLSPSAIQQYFVDNTPGPHWTSVVTGGLQTALTLWQQAGGN